MPGRKSGHAGIVEERSNKLKWVQIESGSVDPARTLCPPPPAAPPYFSGVRGVVHDADPALEDGHLEEGEVRVANMVKGHDRPGPSEVVLGQAGRPIGDQVGAQHVAVLVETLTGKAK